LLGFTVDEGDGMHPAFPDGSRASGAGSGEGRAQDPARGNLPPPGTDEKRKAAERR
jgi:hypothetical protein